MKNKRDKQDTREKKRKEISLVKNNKIKNGRGVIELQYLRMVKLTMGSNIQRRKL